MPNPSSLKNRSGFTIIELIITLMVMGILAGISYPIITSWLPREKLKSAARDLVSDLQTAKSLAVEKNTTYTLLFDDSSTPGKYFCFHDANSNSAFDSATETKIFETDFNSDENKKYNIDFGTGNAVNDWNGNAIASSIALTDKVIVFDQKGLADRSGSVFLKNKNNDICYSVSITGVGSLKIREFNGSSW
jgi:prepilin-type N-terminal cleavage/methylation domain-containing protein